MSVFDWFLVVVWIIGGWAIMFSVLLIIGNARHESLRWKNPQHSKRYPVQHFKVVETDGEKWPKIWQDHDMDERWVLISRIPKLYDWEQDG